MALTTLEDRIVAEIGKHSVPISEIHAALYSFRPTRRTLQRVLRDLVKKNILRQTGVRRSTRYEKIS